MSDMQKKYNIRGCHTCGNMDGSEYGCNLKRDDWQTCIENKSRPFWRPNKDASTVGREQAIETDYRPDSLVALKKKKIQQLVDAHWSYMEKLLTAGQDQTQKFTWDQVMAMRKWDYTSAATHFYGHGYEDGRNDDVE